MPTTVSPFETPLTRHRFRVALQRGQGRILVHIRRCGASGVEDLILDACAHDGAYDPQCECDRAKWLFEIIDAAGLEAAALRRIIRALANDLDSENFWDRSHLSRLALIFARRGHAEARISLYSSLCKCENSADIIASEEIIELDGTDGLLFVTERAGQWITDDPKTYVGNFPMSFYDEKHRPGSAERVLRAAAEQNAHIATYLNHLDTNSETDVDNSVLKPGAGTIKPDILQRFGTNRKPRFDAMRSWAGDDIIREIENTDPSENRNRFLYRRWGKQASEQDLRTVAEKMFAEKDEKLTRIYLHVFLKCGLPEMNSWLQRLADSEDRATRWIAYKVLANHDHPTVRSLAINRISAGKMSEGELCLFRKNYRQGDWRLIEDVLRLPGDDYELHEILSDLLEVFEANKVEESCNPMMLVYEHSPCGICRGNAVKALIDLARAPDWVLEECRFDADEETRSIVGTP